MSRKTKVMDSWPIVAFFEDEQPAAGKVEALLAEAHASGSSLLITTVNLGEVWYSIARAHSAKEADKQVRQIHNLGIEVVSVGWDLSYEAAMFKVQGNISYADCFALALAKIKKADLVTGDKEFEQFDGEVKILWMK